MNKSYKNVWNESTGTYVAASEVTKSRGKSTRSQKALVTALLAAGVGFGTAVKAEAAATPNSFAAGILGTDTSNSDCISSADGAQVVTNGDCSAAKQQAGIVSYDSSGTAGAYFTVTDPNTAHIGAGGVDQMKITNSGVFVLNTLDMGGKKITNLAAGTVSASSTDAVNGTQLFTTNSNVSDLQTTVKSINGNGITYFHAVAAVGGGDSTAAAAGDIAIGGRAKATSNGLGSALAIGSDSSALANSTVAIGPAAKANSKGDAAFGMNAQATGNGQAAVALGQNSNATTNASVALGANATASANNSVALGANSVTTRLNTVSVGATGATRQVVNVAAGTQATDAVNYAQLQAAGLTVDSSGNATNSFVAYDDMAQGKVTLAGASGTKLSNVAAGSVSASSKDAVNGAQLYSSAASTASALGGGSSVNADGTVSAPAYSVNNTTVNNVGAAISNIDDRVTKNTEAVDTLATKVDTINDQMTDVVKYDTSAHDTVTLSGPAGTKLTNVAAGAVSASSTDAVNGSQLYATNQDVSKNADDIASVDNRVTKVEDSVDDLTTQLNAGTVGLVQQDATSGALSVASTSGGTSFDFTGSAGSRELLGVAAGKTATSAVNLGQLSPVVTALGGGAQVNEDGTVSAPAYSVENTTVNNVGAAISNIDGRVTKNTDAVDTLATKVDTINDQMTDVMKYDTSAHDTVKLAGASGTTLSNVKAGELTASSSDAVNGSQLYATVTEGRAGHDHGRIGSTSRRSTRRSSASATI